MPDYIYLLENRLSPAQQSVLRVLRDVARDKGMTIFLTGGAVRDLTSGSSVRDLDVTVQGNALSLMQAILNTGATLWGKHESSQTLFLHFPGSVRMEVSSARRDEFPKPGEPVYKWASIHDDLRRRDFTVNAMALSLNDGSYGLLMDPTNGVADLEMRMLRLVSNYGFLEDPIRLIRAARLSARLGWHMDEKTKARFDAAIQEGVISAISAYQRGYELEEIGFEENPLEMLKALEAEGWTKYLYPSWTVDKADVQGLEQMHEVLTRLEMQGIHPEGSTAAMELLTAKMQPKERAGLKALFVRPGFAADWERLDADASDFAKQLTAKDANTPSATWKLFMRANPEAVLWLALTGKGAAVQNKFKNFFNVWPEAKQKVPTVLMLEMRITPELDRYPELLQELFYGTIDGKLETEEQLRAFLEPYSPPAPPPPVTVRRPRASKKAAGKKQAETPDESSQELLATAPEPYQEEVERENALREIPGMAPVKGLGKAVREKVVPVEKSPAAPADKSVSGPKKGLTAKTKLERSPVEQAGRLAGKKIAQEAPATARSHKAKKAIPEPAKAEPVKSAKKATPSAKVAAKAVPTKAAHAKAGKKSTAAPAKKQAAPAKGSPKTAPVPNKGKKAAAPVKGKKAQVKKSSGRGNAKPAAVKTSKARKPSKAAQTKQKR